MAPLSFEGSAQEAQRRMREILERIPRSILREDRPGRLAVSFRSRIFRFVDDAEFVFDGGKKEVHFRSGARVGYYDFGVNRARMERIARAFRDSSPSIEVAG
jgi:uncharacterized protein (DUF1499 family)